MADCLDLAQVVTLILDAVLGSGAFDRSAVADLVRAGRPDLLIGQPENQWFDAKRGPYVIRGDGARFEFAKDVAAFANTGGGLIVCARGQLGRRLSTQQVCLPMRDGEETDYSSVGEIHALLVAGRVAFASSNSATSASGMSDSPRTPD